LTEGTVVQTANFGNAENNGLFKVTEVVGYTINVTNVDNTEAHLVAETPATGAVLHVHDGITQLREGVPGSETFDVSLTRAPTADVLVTLTADSQVNISYDGQSTDSATRTIQLTFTPTDWATKTVDIEAVFDNAVEGFHFGNVTATVQSTDYDQTIEAPTKVFDALPEGEVLPTSVDLPHKPIPGTVVVTFETEPDTFDHIEVVSNTVLFLNAANKPVEVDGQITVDYDYIEPGYGGTPGDPNDSVPVRRIVAAITDDNAPGVLITESKGSTDVIEFDGSFLSDVDETISKENSVNGDFEETITKHNAIGDFEQTITKSNVVSAGNVLVYEFDLGEDFVPSGSATLTFDITADIDLASENISVVADAGEAGSINLGNLFDVLYDPANSLSHTATASITLTQTQLETLLANGAAADRGKVTLTVTPSADVGDFTGAPDSLANSLAVTLSVDAAELVYEFDLGKYFVPSGDATLTFDITADINSASEYISVVADAGEAGSIDLGNLFDQTYSGADAQSHTATASITLTQAQLETLLANGTAANKGKITITVTPSAGVNNFTSAPASLDNSLAVTLSAAAAELVYEFDLGKYFVPSSDATLTFEITADINSASEYISVVADAGEAGSIDLGNLFDQTYSGADPQSHTATASITLTKAQLETLLSNGTEEDKGKFTLTIKPSAGVDNFTSAPASLANSLAVSLAVEPDKDAIADNLGLNRLDTYDIVLTSEPDHNVTVYISTPPTPTSLLVTPIEQMLVSTPDGTGTVTFTPGNWSTPQTVTVFAVDDAVVDGGDTKVFAQQLHTVARPERSAERSGANRRRFDHGKQARRP
jgi:hypothetical protein